MFHVEHVSHFPRKTIKTDISEGETPEIREACPIVEGLILESFSLASDDKRF